MTDNERVFWMAVFVASIARGTHPDHAAIDADAAVEHYRKRVPEAER